MLGLPVIPQNINFTNINSCGIIMLIGESEVQDGE